MRILTAAILVSYALLIGHEAGHRPGTHYAAHSHADRARALAPDHTHGHDHSHPHDHHHDHGSEPQGTDGEDQSGHEHESYVHGHSSIASRAAQYDSTDAPPPFTVSLSYSEALSLMPPQTGPEAPETPPPPRLPTYLRCVSLLI